MSKSTLLPHLTQEGVAFNINLNSVEHECLISRDALVKLSLSKNIDASDAETMDIFHAFESTIKDMTRTLIAAQDGKASAGRKGKNSRPARFHSE